MPSNWEINPFNANIKSKTRGIIEKKDELISSSETRYFFREIKNTIPKTRQRFAMLLPTIIPRARFPAFSTWAAKVENSSGRDVPIARSKDEAINGVIFAFSAKSDKNFIVKLEDNINANRERINRSMIITKFMKKYNS